MCQAAKLIWSRPIGGQRLLFEDGRWGWTLPSTSTLKISTSWQKSHQIERWGWHPDILPEYIAWYIATPKNLPQLPAVPPPRDDAAAWIYFLLFQYFIYSIHDHKNVLLVILINSYKSTRLQESKCISSWTRAIVMLQFSQFVRKLNWETSMNLWNKSSIIPIKSIN